MFDGIILDDEIEGVSEGQTVEWDGFACLQLVVAGIKGCQRFASIMVICKMDCEMDMQNY